MSHQFTSQKCGKLVDPFAKFCIGCGNKLQFNPFGNPDRPVTVRINPDFDSRIIHLDT